MRTSAIARKYFSITLLALILSPLVLASPAIEVVQSVPVETSLAVPGIRYTQEVWIEMIRSAKTSIDLEEFYIYHKAGESLEPVLNELEAAAARGVQIRFIVDSKFYETYPAEPNRLAKVENIQVRVLDFSSHGGIQHSKYFIVDQKEVFSGSANFDWLALSHIHEVGLRVSDEQVAQQIGRIFDKDWNAAGGVKGSTTQNAKAKSPIVSPENSSLRVIASPPSANPEGIPQTLDALLDLLNTAQKKIQIQVYEYSTKIFRSSGSWNVLDQALRQAASRGVEVQLLVDALALRSGKEDLEELNQIPGIQVKVVNIPEWSGGPLQYARLIHSKYVVVDNDRAWLGSENWSKGYFTQSRNIGMIIHSEEVNGQLRQIFNKIWTSTYASSPRK